jgi:hypothetical protein
MAANRQLMTTSSAYEDFCDDIGDDEPSLRDWEWYQGLGPAKLFLDELKHIMLNDRPKRHTRRLLASLKARIKRGSKKWLGNRVNNACLLLLRATEPQKRAKRIPISSSLDKQNVWVMNIRIAVLLLQDMLSREQIDGIIDNTMVPSVTCGNWNCVAPQHLTVESRKANKNRPNCHEDGRCHFQHGPHEPPCLIGMKEEEEDDDDLFNVSNL